MIIKKASNVFVASWLQAFINFITGIIVAVELGASGKGYAVLFISTVNTFGVICLIGLPPALLYYVQKKNFSIDKIFTSFLLFSFAVFIINLSILNFFNISNILEIELKFLEKVFFSLCLFIFLYNNLFSTLILGLGNSKNYSILIITKSFLFLILIFLFLKFLNYDLIFYFVAYFITELFFLIFITIILKIRIGVKILNFKILDKTEIHQLLIYSFKNYPNALIALYQNSFINYLVLFLIGVEAVGIFSIATAFHNLMNSVPRAVNTLLIGEAAKLNNSKKIFTLLQTSRFLNSILLLVSFFGIILVGYIIDYFYGKEFIESIIPAKIMIFCAILTSNITTFQSYLLANNQPLRVSGINLINMIMSICFVFLLTKFFNINGIALSFLISKFLIMLYMLRLLKKNKIYTNLIDLIIITKNDFKILFKN